jgi:hypothetical protein
LPENGSGGNRFRMRRLAALFDIKAFRQASIGVQLLARILDAEHTPNDACSMRTRRRMHRARTSSRGPTPSFASTLGIECRMKFLRRRPFRQ